jgi:flagellar biosynthesis/type III secretory pathway M-ring protein FliF/YscJ
MENEVMMNEEVLETTEEVCEAESGKGLIALAVVGTIIVGGIVFTKVIKPAIAKIKAKKAAKADAEYETEEYQESDSIDD